MEPSSQKKPFRFKQFEIHQDRCAMKVGTDGVLLGSWTPIQNKTESILDIGAGTGVIALMLAQRTDAETIDAIEIDDEAYEQCVENFEASPWADRLFCFHAGLDEMTAEMEDSYDLIVSNPPFHTEEVDSGSEARNKARQNSSLPFDELLSGVDKLISPKGIFATIIPFQTEVSFLASARESGLHPFRITRVKGTPQSPFKRSLLAFSRLEKDLKEEELVIELERHVYSAAYIDLCKDFYLKM